MKKNIILTLLIIGFLSNCSQVQCANTLITTVAPAKSTTKPLVQTPVKVTKTAKVATVTTQVQTTPAPIQPQTVEYSSCNKIFNIDSQKLLYLTLSSLNANRFPIDEIQSTSGYAVFSVGQREFLATVITINAQNSMLKITPCNNNYFFPIGIPQNVFKYIELNINTPVEKLPVT